MIHFYLELMISFNRQIIMKKCNTDNHWIVSWTMVRDCIFISVLAHLCYSYQQHRRSPLDLVNIILEMTLFDFPVCLLLLLSLAGSVCLVQSLSTQKGMRALLSVPGAAFQLWWIRIALRPLSKVSRISWPARTPWKSEEPHWMAPLSHHQVCWSRGPAWRRSMEQVCWQLREKMGGWHRKEKDGKQRNSQI